MSKDYNNLIVILIAVVALLGFIYIFSDVQANPQVCGVENCHGLEITCGSEIPDFCTEIYMFGDKCRQYASCKTVQGECLFIPNKAYERCKSCVNSCVERYSNDIIKMSTCESKCK